MFFISVKSNQQQLLQKLLNSRVFVEKGWTISERIMRRKFDGARALFFKEFDEHPVSKEIMAGPDEVGNESGLLGGYGNLFSFFGFKRGENPIADVALHMRIQFGLDRGSYRGKRWVFRVRMPDKDEVAQYVIGKYGVGDYTTSESWIEGVEKGYSGLSYYLSFVGKGRSGGGLQWDTPVNELTFSTTKYLSEITDNFKNRMKP